MLTHGYWQRRFGGADNVVGRSITVDGNPVEIVGVLPASFRFLRSNASILMPFQFDRANMWVGNFSYRGVARLRPGVTLEQANADIARMIPMVPQNFPLPPGFTMEMFREIRLGPNLRPLSADVIGDVGRVLWILLGTVGIVLLIACANVANLFLVQAEGRQQELAVRTALGASRGRIARELLGESLLLALAGGAIGLLLARAGIALLVHLAPAGLPRLEEIGLDWTVLLFTLGASGVAALLFGLVPVIRFGTPSVTALKEGGRSASDGRDRHRARNILATAEIALALVLLVVSGLMVRTFVALRSVDPGFRNPEAVQTFRISVPEAVVADPAAVVRTHEQIVAALERVPGVESVGLSSSLTLDGNNSNDPIFAEGITAEGGPMPPLRRFKWIGPGYLETMGNRLVAGRTIAWEDIEGRRPVAMISEGFARELYGSPAGAIGRRIRETPQNPWREIVGVAGDERDNGLHEPAPTTVYWPMAMERFWHMESYVSRSMGYAVRTSRAGSPTLLAELQRAVWSVNPALPVANPRTLADIRASSMAQTSFALTMLGIAAVVALLLGLVGIYGVIACVAAQRTREIGVRMALGAQARDVARLFLAHGVKIVVAGVAIGLVAAAGVTRVMSALLFGVQAVDPLTYAAMALALAAVALVATWLPARRAAKLDPMVALRTDA
jgi:predicted permease